MFQVTLVDAGNEVSVQVLLEGYSKSGMGSTILCTNCEG